MAIINKKVQTFLVIVIKKKKVRNVAQYVSTFNNLDCTLLQDWWLQYNVIPTLNLKKSWKLSSWQIPFIAAYLWCKFVTEKCVAYGSSDNHTRLIDISWKYFFTDNNCHHCFRTWRKFWKQLFSFLLWS